MCSFLISPSSGLQPVVTLICIPNNTLIRFPLVHAGEMKVSGRKYLVMALGVSDAFLAVSPVGHRVHNVSHVPIFVLEFFNDLRMEENEYINEKTVNKEKQPSHSSSLVYIVLCRSCWSSRKPDFMAAWAPFLQYMNPSYHDNALYSEIMNEIRTVMFLFIFI